MATHPDTGSLTVVDFLLMVLIFAALVIRLSLAPPIWHHGEAREGLVVQGVIHDHQWILPFRNSELPSKPPLFHWVAALLALPLGFSDFSVRLPSVIAAEIMVIATFLMGMAMGNRKTAWLGVGALLGMYEFWNSATQARVDMVLAACVTVSVTGFFFWYRTSNQAARVTCYLASACAVLAKGPVGIALPGLVIAGFLLTVGEFRVLCSFWSWPLAGLVLLIDGAWYACAYHVGGNEFLRLQLLHENVDRFLGTGAFAGHHAYLNTPIELLTGTFPWSLVLPWSLIRRLRGEREDSAGHLLHAWWIAISAIFFLAAAKRGVYLLPTYPAVALLAARAIADAFRFVSVQQPSADTSHRMYITRGVGIGIALFDLALMLGSLTVYRHVKPWEARLAFVNKISAMVPGHAALFATPELDNTDRIIIAYRLRRKIDRKAVPGGNQDDHFLIPIKRVDLIGGETRVLASSEIDKIALVTVPKSRESNGQLTCDRGDRNIPTISPVGNRSD